MDSRFDFDGVLDLIEQECFDKLEKVVGINSFTLNAEGVNENGRTIASWFEPLGFEAQFRQETAPGCGQHLALCKKGSGSQNIIMVSHLDTVYTREEEKRFNFSFTRRGDRFFGPGVADIKGGSVLIYMVLKALSESAPEVFNEFSWTILVNASEETYSETFASFARSFAGPDTVACLVFEAGRVDKTDPDASTFVIARNAVCRFNVTVTGRGAHSGIDHVKGANAIRQMARLVETIESFTDYGRELTFNVGIINGGTAANCVPAECTAKVDMRAKNMEDYREGVEKILALAGSADVASYSDGFLCRIDVEESHGYVPWPVNDASSKLAALYEQCAGTLGLKIRGIHEKAASDAAVFWDLVPTIDGVGPVGANIHSPVDDPENGKFQESVSIPSFKNMARVNLAVLTHMYDGARFR